MRYRKKPIVIEAFQLPCAEWPEWADNQRRIYGRPLVGDIIDMGQTVEIHTLEGVMVARLGDWIIKGVKGELYPCKPDIFAATYEAAE